MVLILLLFDSACTALGAANEATMYVHSTPALVGTLCLKSAIAIVSDVLIPFGL